MLCLGAASPAGAGTSTLQNPTVTFTTFGPKQVTLTACNGTFCTTSTQTVTVLNPAPVLTGAAVSPTVAEVGQLVHLTASGTGKPPVSFLWQVTPPASSTLSPFTLSGASIWWDTTGLSPGDYTFGASLSNNLGSSSAPLPMIVTLAASASDDFYTMTPCRVYDSRSGSPLASGSTTVISVVAAACGIPSNARAIAGNLTVVNPTDLGYAALYPGNYPQPSTSTTNFTAGSLRGNGVIMELATDGSGTLDLGFVINNGGSAHAVLDVTGYFLPSAPGS